MLLVPVVHIFVFSSSFMNVVFLDAPAKGKTKCGVQFSSMHKHTDTMRTSERISQPFVIIIIIIILGSGLRILSSSHCPKTGFSAFKKYNMPIQSSGFRCRAMSRK